mgnify:CR=1 FL=1
MPGLCKLTNAQACSCGEHWFAPTSLWWIAIVDSEDRQLLQDYKWSASGKYFSNPFYANSTRYYRETGNSGRLHQIVTGHIYLQLDHVNGNGHDCRKVNLRPCNHTQNQYNRGARGVSGYKGVYETGEGKWIAHMRVEGCFLCLGTFGFKTDAAIAYNYAAAHLHNEFVKLNEITEWFHD